jgi:tRNA pseudouridine38-40 synthase
MMNEGVRNIKLTVAYDGTNYSGWQRQAEDTTLQAVIEEKIGTMVAEPVKLIASGRTDAGVHALGQVCHFQTHSQIGTEELKKGLNSMLPDDILIMRAESVPLEFHARYDARKKTYEYRILNRAEPDIFNRNFLWHIHYPLDTDGMSQCLALLEGTHDFSSFRSQGSGNLDPVRTVYRARIQGPRDGRLCIIMEANGFLRHMVRNIVGTLVEVGRGKRDVDEFRAILEAGDRGMAGMKAPPQGLFLVRVEY